MKRGERIRQTLKNKWLHDFKIALIEADFARLNRAYNVLRDQEKRANYDEKLREQGRIISKEPEPEESQSDQTNKASVQPIDTYLATRIDQAYS